MKSNKYSIKNFNVLRHIILLLILLPTASGIKAQINTDQVMNIGRNALYFEDYILSIQYFNQVISAKPYLAEPYFYRSIAKLNLDDYKGAEEDATLAIERNKFIIDAYQVRGIARQTLRKEKLAIQDYDEGLKQMPEHKTFLLNKAVCQVAIKDYKGAEKTYGRLITLFPNLANAYLGRAQLLMAEGDTTKALPDIDKSISINKNNSGAFVMRSEIKMRHKNDYPGALEDMNEAIKLEPHFSGYFINRAFMKYRLDDYFGAMADYDYAISLDPANVTAHYNRGLLKTEVGENNKAIDDFSYVLCSDPTNLMARYNRAMLYNKTGQYKHAIKDYDVLLSRYPNFQMALFARSECKRLAGDLAGGERDYNRSRELYKKRRHSAGDPDLKGAEPKEDNGESLDSEAAVKNKFNTLLTVVNDNDLKPEYDNKARGKVQDNNIKIESEPIFHLSYYDKEDKIRGNTNYMREIADANATHMLQYVLLLTNKDVSLDEDEITKHFNSVEYYNGILATSDPRSIDYLGRGMDFIVLKNPQQAIADLDRAIKLTPKFTLAYFARANAKYLQYELNEAQWMSNSNDNSTNTASEAMLKSRQDAHTFADIISDYNKVLELSPKNVYAMFNIGNIYMKMNDLTSAITSYSNAVDVKPDFGEAYYNRGLAYLRLGNKEKGVQDLSKAGELGILPSYNVLKRMQ